MSEIVNAGQIASWNAATGLTWVNFQDQLDAQLGDLGLRAMQALAPKPGEHILDIGCGCGHTTLQLAGQVGPAGAAVGVDISRQMLDVAKSRKDTGGVDNGSFLELDAETGDLGHAAFNAAYSRFGVMFFADSVAAFANIAGALKPGGRLAFVCWRALEYNIWMREPLEAAEPNLPPRAPQDPLAPGPFAFANPDRIRRILSEAGFADISIDAFDTAIGGSDLDRSVTLALKVGPLGSALREAPERVPLVADVVKEVLARYQRADGIVQMPASVWIVTART